MSLHGTLLRAVSMCALLPWLSPRARRQGRRGRGFWRMWNRSEIKPGQPFF
jgi:hypothetical protein